jgi:hypothetical protein
VLSNLNVSAQVALPEWVRARGLAIFMTVYFGAHTADSALWGQVAAMWGLPRVTNADRVLQTQVQRFQLEGMPKVTHMIAAERA